MNRTWKRLAASALLLSFMAGIAAVMLAGSPGTNEASAGGIYQALDATTSTGAPTTFPGRIVRIVRNVTYEEYGMFSSKDEIWFENNADVPVSSIYMCNTQAQANQLYEMRVFDVAGTRLHFTQLPYQVAGFVTWRIVLPTPVLPGNQRSITVFQHFRDNVDIEVSLFDQVFEFNHVAFTIVPYAVFTATSEIKLPSGSTVKEHSPDYGVVAGTLIRYSAADADAFNHEPLHVIFSSPNTRLVENSNSRLSIKVNNDRDWSVDHQVSVKNNGKVVVVSVLFHVPADAYGFVARDSIGTIRGLAVADSAMYPGFKDVSVSLTSNRYVITRDSTLTMTLSFMLPGAPRMQKGDTNSILTMDLFRISWTQWASKNAEIRVILPQSTEINMDMLNLVPEAIDNQGGEEILIFRRDTISPKHTQLAYIEFSYNMFQMQARPFLLALAAGLVASIYVVVRKATMKQRRPDAIAEEVEVPMETMNDFTSIFEEKVALYMEMERLNENLKRGKIKKREYVIKVEEALKRVRNLDEEIKGSKRKLVDFGGRLREIVEELDVYEAERQAVQDALVGLERRYKEGKIKSRVAYEKLYDSYSARLKKIQSGLDSGTNELKSYLV